MLNKITEKLAKSGLNVSHVHHVTVYRTIMTMIKFFAVVGMKRQITGWGLSRTRVLCIGDRGGLLTGLLKANNSTLKLVGV